MKAFLSHTADPTFCHPEGHSIPDVTPSAAKKGGLGSSHLLLGSQSLPLAHAFLICSTLIFRSKFPLYRVTGGEERGNRGAEALGPGSFLFDRDHK